MAMACYYYHYYYYYYYYPIKPNWKTVRRDCSCSISSCCSFNNSFSSYNVSYQQSNRFHFITFSVEPSAASSQANTSTHVCYSQIPLNHVKNEKGNIGDGLFSVVQNDDEFVEKKKENAQTPNSVQIIRNLPLWRSFESKKTRSILLLNAITIVYGICISSDIPVLKAVEDIMDPAVFCAVRFVMSAIPFLPFVFQARDDVDTRNAGIELGLWISLGYFFEALGLLTSDAGRASFISMFTVIVVPLLDGMLGSIIPAHTWFGVLMSVLGVGMLECSGSPPNVGDLLNFLSAIFFGIHMLRTERISRSTKKKFLPLLGYEVCVVALLSTIWVLVGGWFDRNQDFDQSQWTWTMLWDWMMTFPWVPALYTGIFSTGICLWIEISAMLNVSATEAAIIYGMEPLWGAGFAWFLLGERWGTAGWIGAAFVLGGSLLVQMYGSLSPNKSKEAEECNKNGSLLLIPEMDKQKLQKNLSTSPVVVTSKTDMLK